MRIVSDFYILRGLMSLIRFAEALLWAVMFERGWIWTGEKFENKGGKMKSI